MSKKDIYGGNFFPPDPNDPFYNVLVAGGNMVVGYGLKWASRKVAGVMGLSETSIEKQIALNLSRLKLEKQQADTNRAKTLGEMQVRYWDLKIEQKKIEVEERKRHIDNARIQQAELNAPSITQVVVGALEVAATPDGLVDSGCQSEGYAAWLDSFQSGKVLAILGKRGSGKSALGAKIAGIRNGSSSYARILDRFAPRGQATASPVDHASGLTHTVPSRVLYTY